MLPAASIALRLCIRALSALSHRECVAHGHVPNVPSDRYRCTYLHTYHWRSPQPQQIIGRRVPGCACFSLLACLPVPFVHTCPGHLKATGFSCVVWLGSGGGRREIELRVSSAFSSVNCQLSRSSWQQQLPAMHSERLNCTTFVTSCDYYYLQILPSN